eukprot:858459-Amphidinium_carterae.1
MAATSTPHEVVPTNIAIFHEVEAPPLRLRTWTTIRLAKYGTEKTCCTTNSSDALPGRDVSLDDLSTNNCTRECLKYFPSKLPSPWYDTKLSSTDQTDMKNNIRPEFADVSWELLKLFIMFVEWKRRKL